MDSDSETAPLLSERASSQHHVTASQFLPVSFLASLGMAATVATTIYAYADLLCTDPTACEDSEQSAYAAVVAIANGLAHTIAILILGPLQHLVNRYLRAGLFLWIICRAASVVCLVIGVAARSVPIAVSGRVFEGLASDNLLHFNLNTIYVSLTSSTRKEASRPIAASLALYMLGTAVAPIAVTVFRSYTASFTTALMIFALTIAYLAVFVRQPVRYATCTASNESAQPGWHKSPLQVLLSPLRPFYVNRTAIPYGLSLLLYTAVQGHLFPVIMVFASIRFHFGTFENGLIVSTAAICAAFQISFQVYVAPMLVRFGHWLGWGHPDISRVQHQDRNAVVGALVLQMVALSAITQVRSPIQLYLAVALSSAGLAVPAFFKAHFVSFMPNAPQAISALTFMESVGGLISPFVLGAWQAVIPGASVFFLAVALLGTTLGLFLVACLLHSSGRH
ncbi:hypothetical protein BDV27DRAFT_170276 [Aspergillus caelatus]|uniref:Major facilitator superfamily domain-containing protein n=1 Tax=Aspergillus caelatus TaxID=61420 RepID=A0A5N7ACX6_9EURO|nr:uncharacterized protein BDV27DRAFT_170276 [Aspergillus caelatus]KAE8367006.1 hypothetical protein BDV27DRAFT_170276 [Aspergillus caelatus]